jgi:hypothetical protein
MEPARRIESRTLSVGEAFRSPTYYKVPSYQRDFAWTSEEVGTLWEDVAAAIDDGRDEYFLGTLVTSPAAAEKTREVVDGQQRLAVLSMFFAAISREWTSRGDQKRADSVFRDYLGSEDRRTEAVIPKLTLNELNDSVFQKVVLKGGVLKTAERKLLERPNRLLVEAYELVVSRLKKWLEGYEDQESALLDLDDFISAKVQMILIDVGDASDAFVIFETLNDRGLDLAIADLVKNYLFSLARGQIDKFKSAWGDISLLVGSGNLTQFLRHYWLSEVRLVRERDLYRALRSTAKSAPKARQLLERLRKVADYYAALTNPEHAYWADFSSDARSHLEALLLFKVTQFRPVALAAMERFSADNMTKLLRLLKVISFRYTVVSGLGTGNLERVYTDAALAIRSGKAKSPKAVFELLKSAYVTDDRFAQDFAAKRFTKAGVARYVLAEINDDLESDKERMVAEGTGRITLEHIMPKSPGPGWKNAVPSGEDSRDFVDAIGNLTLLEKGKNRGIANAAFKTKKEKAYEKSSLHLNKKIAATKDWTSADINRRCKALAKSARTIWKVSY